MQLGLAGDAEFVVFVLRVPVVSVLKAKHIPASVPSHFSPYL
jgi:hypothetical protein